MQTDNELGSYMLLDQRLNADNRPIRLKLFHQNKQTNDVLLPQLVHGTESIGGGFEYQVNCVATSYILPLKEFIGLAATLEFVNDRGRLRADSYLSSTRRAGSSRSDMPTVPFSRRSHRC